MKTTIKADNIIQVQAIVKALSFEFTKLNIELRNILINNEMRHFITVKNKNLHALDIYTVLRQYGIRAILYYTINRRRYTIES